MTALDDLRSGAHTAKDVLDGSLTAATDLEKQTDDLAQQFAALGNEGSAQILAQSASLRLATVREHLANAQQELAAYVQDCEQAKGGWLPWQPGESPSSTGPSASGAGSAGAAAGRGWDASGITDNEKCPRTIALPDDRREHILDVTPAEGAATVTAPGAH